MTDGQHEERYVYRLGQQHDYTEDMRLKIDVQHTSCTFASLAILI